MEVHPRQAASRWRTILFRWRASGMRHGLWLAVSASRFESFDCIKLLSGEGSWPGMDVARVGSIGSAVKG